MATRRVRVVIASLTKFVESIVKAVVSNITNNLVQTTPVDTGWARSNWIAKVRGPLSSPVGSKTSVSSAFQQQALLTIVTSYKLRTGPVHITNNVPHIVFLNEGSSRQAPRGFVQAAIAKGTRADLAAALGA
jgi:hypothetical protein